jgi:hypothetical protein
MRSIKGRIDVPQRMGTDKLGLFIADRLEKVE